MFKYFIIQMKKKKQTNIAEIPPIIALLLTFRQEVKKDMTRKSEQSLPG